MGWMGWDGIEENESDGMTMPHGTYMVHCLCAPVRPVRSAVERPRRDTIDGCRGSEAGGSASGMRGGSWLAVAWADAATHPIRLKMPIGAISGE